MTQHTADLPITVDLNVVAKYHTVTKVKVSRLTKQDIATDSYADTLKVFVIKTEDELHPAFDYWKYAADAGLTEPTANNLLYLIYANCLYEWRVYSESLVTTDPSRDLSLVSQTPDELNLVFHAREELTKIRELCLLLESHPTETDISFSYRSGAEKKGKAAREKYKLLGVKISDSMQIQSILKHTIDLLFRSAKEGPNDILREILKDKQPDYNTIHNLLEFLPTPPLKLDDAVSSFRKHLINICIKFLNDEAALNITKDNFSIAEAMLVYSAFSLFQLITPTLIENHIDNTSRVKYIRSMALNAGNIKKLNPKAEVKEGRNYTFKDISFVSETNLNS